MCQDETGQVDTENVVEVGSNSNRYGFPLEKLVCGRATGRGKEERGP